MKTISQLIGMLFIISIFSAFALIKPDKFEGTWKYKAQDTPYEYSTGKIEIVKDGNDYKVVLTTNYEMFTASNVTIDGNQMTFKMYMGDMDVDVSINVEKDTFTGKASTYEGSYTINGKRSS